MQTISDEAGVLGGSEESATMVDVLRRRAQLHPDRRLYTFLAQGEREEAQVTYGDLDRQARAIAVHVQGVADFDDRAVLLYPPGLDFIAAFFGCLYAGLVPVPVPPERERASRPISRLPAVLRDAGAHLVLCTRQILDTITPQIGVYPELQQARWEATDALPADGAERWVRPPIDETALALLQYTSGSTGQPKGVMVSHRNLIYNERMIRVGMDQDEGSVMVGWLPLYHDMGLIGNVLLPLFVGGSCILMPPLSFLQKPARWLRAISTYRGTIAGAPNFAYDLCSRTVRPEERDQLDLSSWSVAYNGAEPVRADTLDRFAQTFGPCGFRPQTWYPCYGLAEATLFVSGGQASAAPLTQTVDPAALEHDSVVDAAGAGRTLVSSGQSWLDESIAIVDPESRTVCPPHRVGEVWVSGPNVAEGYWNQPGATEETFHARRADGDERCYLRTGDLGFIHAGELFITGRLKDVIIIRGSNHYPQDIEYSVERSHSVLRPGCGAAFSLEDAGQEGLAVVQEVDRRYRATDLPEVVAAIREAVAEDHGLQIATVILVEPGGVSKTTSGKIRRSTCRSRFLAGELPVVGQWALSR